MTINLTRFIKTPHGTFGRLTVPGKGSWFTVENNDTLIPSGTHLLALGYYDKGGYQTYEILVDCHDELLIHAANRARELKGCVAPGMSLDFLDGELAVMHSKTALKEFMAAMHGLTKDYIVIFDPKESV